MGKVELQHYSIKTQTPWMAFTQKHYTLNQITKQRETYTAIVDELQEMKNWLHKCYEAEVDVEIHEVEQCGGDILKMYWPRVSEDLHPGNEALYIGTDKKGTHPNIRLAGSEFDGGNSLACQWCWESESMERQKYTLSQDEGASPDMHIPSPWPIDKSKVAKLAPMKKKAISMQEYYARGQCRQAEQECQEAECKQKEEEEALCRWEEMRQMDQEHLERMARIKESREWEEKAQRDAKQELVRCTMEAEVARAAELPPQDKNNEELDYYDDIDQDTEMVSSQETVLMTSQESNDTATASSQETVPMSSQESKATAPASSQESMTQEKSMPSLETATGTTILDATSKAPMEDETCLDGPTLKCTPQEERALLNPLLAKSLDHLEDVSLGYLNLIVAHINEIRKTKVSQVPVALPRVLPELPPPQPISTLSEPATTSSLSEAIYSAARNLGTSVPCQTQRMPMHPPVQAKTDQAMRVLEGINKAPGTTPDHSEHQTAP